MSRATYACPKCGTDRIKKLSLVYHDGLSQITSNSVIAGAGHSGVATAVAATQGVQQSESSRRAAPPEPPRREPLGPLIVVAGIIAASQLLDQHAALAVIALVGAL